MVPVIDHELQYSDIGPHGRGTKELQQPTSPQFLYCGHALEHRIIHYFMLSLSPLQNHVYLENTSNLDSVFHIKNLKMLHIFEVFPFYAAFATVPLDRSRIIRSCLVRQPVNETRIRDSPA